MENRFLVTDSAGKEATNSNVLYGKPVADRILKTCTDDSREYFTQYQRRPRLVAILVGGNESSKLYIRNKQRIAEHVGRSLHLSALQSLMLCFIFHRN